ncbi:putative 7tm Odorant receptor-containing protein, partial [Homarus americanus]
MAPPAPSSRIESDLRWLLRMARISGYWPLRETKNPKVKEDDGRPRVDWESKGWREEEETEVFPGPRQEMSWISYPPYLMICTLILFTWSIGYHSYNTMNLIFSGNKTTSEMLVSVPWLGCVVVPWAAGSVAVFLEEWRHLEYRLCRHAPCAPTSRCATVILLVYFGMSTAGNAVLTYQFFEKPSSSTYYGNLTSPPWSWVGYVVQIFGGIPTWASFLVCETFHIITAHHLSTYYTSLNTQLVALISNWRLREGSGWTVRWGSKSMTDTSVAGSRKISQGAATHHMLGRLTLEPNQGDSLQQESTVLDAANHLQEQNHLQDIRVLWDLYEKVNDLLDKFNALFSPIVLANLASFILMICTLLNPVLKVRQGHVQLSLSGVYQPHLDTLLAQISASEARGISAWGYFYVRKETLLTITSVIASYMGAQPASPSNFSQATINPSLNSQP